jgi:hypothetical protein
MIWVDPANAARHGVAAAKLGVVAVAAGGAAAAIGAIGGGGGAGGSVSAPTGAGGGYASAPTGNYGGASGGGSNVTIIYGDPFASANPRDQQRMARRLVRQGLNGGGGPGVMVG